MSKEKAGKGKDPIKKHKGCHNCRFGAGDEFIVCTRFPPIGHPVIADDIMAITGDGIKRGHLMKARTAWPVTAPNDYCGEHKKRRFWNK